jgi:hypothetical protein
VVACELPHAALLGRYADGRAYTDCYATDIAASVSHAEYVEAFYTTAVFKLERLILAWVVSKPSTDEEARRLGRGGVDRFAAWSVEARAPDQLLLCDYQHRTRSWLMTARSPSGREGTRLYFGSAVVARGGRPGKLTLGFHKLYSRVLLRAARSRLLAR